MGKKEDFVAGTMQKNPDATVFSRIINVARNPVITEDYQTG